MSLHERLYALADRLDAFNQWRSPDGYEHMPMPCPRSITEDIREAVLYLRALAKGEKEEAILGETGGEKCAK